jgi:hypothetical protein
MTKWFIKMKHLHDQAIQAYLLCATKLRMAQLKTFLEDKKD